MERKAKLLSPLLVVAMLISMVAGAVAVMVAPQGASAQTGLVVAILSPEPDAEICICQDFNVVAEVWNDTEGNLFDVEATIDIDGPASRLPGEPSTIDIGTLVDGESDVVMWTLHCDAGGDVDITVSVTGEDGVTFSDSLTIMVTQEPECLVDVELYNLNGELVPPSFGTGQCFYVNVAVTNPTDGSWNEVWVRLNRSDSGIVMADNEDATWVSNNSDKLIGTINSKEVGDAWWELCCAYTGYTTLTATAYLGDPAGEPTELCSDYVTVQQREAGLLEVEIVEPCAVGEGDCCLGLTFCESQYFSVKAHVRNVSTSTVLGITAEISHGSQVSTTDPSSYTIGTLKPGQESIVAWHMHCEGGGSSTITVTADISASPEASDSVTVNQLTGNAALVAVITSPVDGAEICAECGNTFTIAALISNPGCNSATLINAELVIDEGDGYVDVAPKTQLVEDIGPGGSRTVTWEVECTDPGTVVFHIEVEGLDAVTLADLDTMGVQFQLGEAVGTGDGGTTVFYLDHPLYDGPVAPGSETIYLDGVPTAAYTIDYDLGQITFTVAPGADVAITANYGYFHVTVYQNALTVDLEVEPAPLTGLAQYSISQEFTVTATVFNCDEDAELTNLWVALELPPTVELVMDEEVTIHYLDLDITDTISPSLDVFISRGLCDCCEAEVTWTLHCIGSGVDTLTATAWADAPGDGAVSTWDDALSSIVTGDGDDADTTTGTIDVTIEGATDNTIPNGTYCISALMDITWVTPAAGTCSDTQFTGKAYVNGETIEIMGSVVTDGATCVLMDDTFVVTDVDLELVNSELTGSIGGADALVSPTLEWTMDITEADFDICASDTVTITQQCKAHLMAGVAVFPGVFGDVDNPFYTTAVDTFSVGQQFTLVGLVTNVGEAAAINVVVTPRIIGDIDIIAGGASQTIDRIAGGETHKVFWVLECTGVGTVEVAIVSLTGTDENKNEAIHQTNIDFTCELSFEQVEAELEVEICQPPPPDIAYVSMEFAVKALITNTGEGLVTGVDATISWTQGGYAMAGASLLAGQTYTKSVGNIAPAGTQEVSWTLHCDDPGTLIITVTAESTAPRYTDSDSVSLVQEGPAELDVEIFSPVSEYATWGRRGPVYYYTYIATSQEFAVTAYISNPGVVPAEDVVATIDTGTWGSYNLSPSTGGWVDDSPQVLSADTATSWSLIAPGDGEWVTWTLHCDYPGESMIEVGASASNVEGGMVYYDSVWLMQYEAAHLEVTGLNTSALDITVSQDFTVTATIKNTGWADAWEVSATLSVDPEGSARVTQGGYTQYLGTLVGWGVNEAQTVSWPMHCKEACNTTLTVTPWGYDEFGYQFSYQEEYYEGNMSADGYLYGDIYVEGNTSVYYEGPMMGSWNAGYEGYYCGCTNGDFDGYINGWVSSCGGTPPYPYFCGYFEGYIGATWHPYGWECLDIPYNMPYNGWMDGYHEDLWFCGDVDGWFSGNKDGWFTGMLEVPIDTWMDVEGYVWGDVWYSGNLSTITTTIDPGAPIPDKFIEPRSVTVKQWEAASLMVQNVTYPTLVDVCQNFTVDAIVKNTGGADALAVVAELHLSANLDATAVDSVSVNLGAIEGGGFALVSWVVHCDGAGSGAIAVSADGTNTTPAVAANGSVIQVAVPVPQPCLVVDVDAPAQITTEQSYFVTAVVSNPCEGQACDVVATITISGEADLASGETAAKNLGCIDPGDAVAVDWEVDATDVGGVNIAVTASGTGANTAVDSAAVQQAEYINLSELMAESLEDINAALESIDGNVATLSSDIGTIKTDVAGIHLTVTNIDEGVATIVTDLGTLNGTVDDISDGVATIATDLGVVKADVTGIAGDTDTLKSRSIWTLPILILVAIGAIALIVGVAIVASRKRPIPVVIERKEEE